VFAYDYLDLDWVEAPHGRAPAVATGVRRVRPDAFVLTYQGDGDLAAIGTAEIIHAAARGELVTAIFVNNGIYGMTGGQMAPTTLLGQKTTTTPAGRALEGTGAPLAICELLATLGGVAFAARVPITSPKNINTAKKYMRMAIRAQLEDVGLGIVEFLATCPVQWHMTPIDAMRYVDQTVTNTFPPGVFVDKVGPASKSAATQTGAAK
jgi:2-oxoglutarate ferredoxin oxidoreductase subunit beta